MSARPRVLYLAPRFPWPLDRGDRLRIYQSIRAFAPVADVTLLALTDEPAHQAPVAPLLELCPRVEVITIPPFLSRLQMLAALPERVPFQVAWFRSEAMSRLVDRVARERFDLAVGYMFRVFPYLARIGGTPLLLDLPDALVLNYRAAAPLKPGLRGVAFQEEMRRVERYEGLVLDGVDEAWVVTELDRQDLLRRRPTANIRVIPNGIEGRWGDAGLEGPKEDAVLFLGNLTVGHNVDAMVHFVRQAWPRVRRARPGARLELVGLAGATVTALGGADGVTVRGYVDDLAPWLRRCRLSVAPIRYAAGIQNKLLETMAAGLPAVATPLVAGPLGAEPGREIVVAETPDAQAEAILALLAEPERALAMGRAGQSYVRARFSWEHAGTRLREILRGL